jgi:hypothetical protein
MRGGEIGKADEHSVVFLAFENRWVSKCEHHANVNIIFSSQIPELYFQIRAHRAEQSAAQFLLRIFQYRDARV